MVKKGETAAHDVAATVTVDDEERTIRTPVVAADGEVLAFDFPDAALVLAEERRRFAQARREDERSRGIAAMLPRADPIRSGASMPTSSANASTGRLRTARTKCTMPPST
ncbi:hypothetical protein [Streptomyces albofaciens]|uniref:hypothetical protein n=1 Tax=Streptomyces albofaciens TaxID=66866 RepID=UPI000AF91DA2|nr:hypothetical protein [Streptomyces albofaciens]